MKPFVVSLTRSTEAGFASVGVDNLEFAPYDHASCRFFSLVHHEGTTLKTKIVTHFVEDSRKDSFFQTWLDFLAKVVAELLMRATVHEEILLS